MFVGSKIKVKNFLFILILLLLANIAFYLYFYGDFSIEAYLNSEQKSEDQNYYFNISLLGDSLGAYFAPGASFYAVSMYKFFSSSMLWSLLINSILFSLAISYLCLEKKKYALVYFILSLPLICHFSIGFTKEAPIILGVALINHSLYSNSRVSFNWALLLMFIAKPIFAIMCTPLYFTFVRKNIKRILFFMLFFTPLYFWLAVLFSADHEYFYRFSNFENTLRGTYPLISILGNIMVMAKFFLENLIYDPRVSVEAIQNAVLQYYSIISTIILLSNFNRFLQFRTYCFLLIFLILTLIPFIVYRYLMPLIFVWAYIVLPSRIPINRP
jgi:hypothetical protein